jgi:hypothetical protein
MAKVAHVRARARQKKPKAFISQRKDEVRNLKSTLMASSTSVVELLRMPNVGLHQIS